MNLEQACNAAIKIAQGHLGPRPITVTTNFTSGGGINRPPRNDNFELRDGPPVAFVAERARHDGYFKDGDFGYRLVEICPTSRGAIYAWPLPVWAILKARVVLRNSFYGILQAMWKRHLIHAVTPECSPIRLRDLRFGAGG